MNIDCISPLTQEVYVSKKSLSASEVQNIVEKAKVAQRKWVKRPLSERCELVLNAVKALLPQQEEAAAEIAHMMGRPVKQFFEFGGCVERAQFMADVAEEALSPIIIEESENFGRRMEKEPLGVVLIIAPWNYPYLTTINTLAPALMAGNAVILKHAAQTLLVGDRLEKTFIDAGIPEDLFVNVVMNHDVSEEVIGAGLFGFVNFTGSVYGGQMIEKYAAGTFTNVGTELGGKDPAYIMEDADIDMAVESLMEGAFFNSGQCCCGIERIYVHEDVYDEFIKKAVEETLKLKLGNPFEDGTTIGPMANIRFAKEVRNQIDDALKLGAKAMIDPKLFPEDDGGVYLAPQILTNVKHDMEFMRQESFGPAVGIMKVKSDGEALSLMNDCEYGLTVSLWTKDAKRAENLGRKLETGTVFMNRCDYLDPAVCWTGCKNTGRGTSLSIRGFDALVRLKSYHLRKKM